MRTFQFSHTDFTLRNNNKNIKFFASLSLLNVSLKNARLVFSSLFFWSKFVYFILKCKIGTQFRNASTLLRTWRITDAQTPWTTYQKWQNKHLNDDYPQHRLKYCISRETIALQKSFCVIFYYLCVFLFSLLIFR